MILYQIFKTYNLMKDNFRVLDVLYFFSFYSDMKNDDLRFKILTVHFSRHIIPLCRIFDRQKNPKRLERRIKRFDLALRPLRVPRKSYGASSFTCTSPVFWILVGTYVMPKTRGEPMTSKAVVFLVPCTTFFWTRNMFVCFRNQSLIT